MHDQNSTHNERNHKVTGPNDAPRHEDQYFDSPEAQKQPQKIILSVLMSTRKMFTLLVTPPGPPTQKYQKLGSPGPPGAHNLHAGVFRHGEKDFDSPEA